MLIDTLEIFPALGVPDKNLRTFAPVPSTVKSLFGTWKTLSIKISGILLISVDALISLYNVVVVEPLTVIVKSVAAMPVNDLEMSSITRFWSTDSVPSNCLENTLPLKDDLVSSPTGPVGPYGGCVKNTVSPIIL